MLVVLAERGVVTLHPNRGAFVAKPERGRSARRVRGAPRDRALDRPFGGGPDRARRARPSFAPTPAPGGGAKAAGDRSESIRLSGQFHLRLAEVAGNAVLTRFLEDLVTRTSLIIGLYGSHSARSCSESEHDALVDALAARDGPRAADVMEHHLKHIESALDIRDVVEAPADIRVVFAR